MTASYFTPCFYAFLACMGFCIIFNIHSPGNFICSLGGGLGWFVYLLMSLSTENVYLCAFTAAAVISAYSEGMARLRKYPVTGYLLVSFIPLVPGAGIYHAMEYCITGDTRRFLEKGMETIGIAGCLAIGVLLVSSAVRMVYDARARRRLS